MWYTREISVALGSDIVDQHTEWASLRGKIAEVDFKLGAVQLGGPDDDVALDG